jgi:hypothetical protein
MTPAIRIIKCSQSPAAGLLAAEKERQILAIAIKVAEASGYVTPDRVDSCVEKLREVSDRFMQRSPDDLARDISKRMSSPEGASAFMAHADLDFDRIMELLEG